MFEAIVIGGSIVVLFGSVWTMADLLRDYGVEPQQITGTLRLAAHQAAARSHQVCSALRSRPISSSTACRAGMSPYRMS